MGPKKLTGFRSFVFFGSIAGLIGLALYPTVIYPYFHIDEYKKIQKVTRAGINQEAVQPGGMKVWSDPFGKKDS